MRKEVYLYFIGKFIYFYIFILSLIKVMYKITFFYILLQFN